VEKIAKRRTLADRDAPVGQISLTLSGFSKQSVVGVETIARIIDALPAFHLTGLREIRYDPDRASLLDLELPPWYQNTNHKAIFIQRQRLIAIYQFDSMAMLSHILYHELGHYVFHFILDGARRKRWLELARRGTKAVTNYAGSSAYEDFAESYAIFVSDPKALSSIVAKYNFLKNNVFGGISANLVKMHLDVTI